MAGRSAAWWMRGVAAAGRQPAAAGLALGIGLVLVTPVTMRHASAQASRSNPQRPSGIPNYGVINAQLSRGGQPDDAGFAQLRDLGVRIVVNLRHEADRIARERVVAERQGMQYVSIPWRGYDTPNTSQVAQFVRLLRDQPGQKVFVHCQRGAERTGVMVACYRIADEGWAAERAVAEMESFGFRRRFAHLARYVQEFPALLRRDPALRGAGLERRN